MKTFEKLLQEYDIGMITATAFATEAISCLESNNVDAVMGSLPKKVMDGVAKFVGEFDSTLPYISFGGARMPTALQVEMAKHWLQERHLVPITK